MNIKNVIKKYDIIPYSQKYLQDFKELLYISLKKTKPENYFLYNTEKTPYGKPIQFLMKWNGMIIGSHSIKPLMFKIKNQKVLGGLTYDSMTAPDFRGIGIFSMLAKKTHEEARRQNYQFVCGYANSNSIGAYQKNVGHTRLNDINFIKITDFDRTQKNSFNVYRNKIPDGIPGNWLQNNKQFDCCMYKDLDFLRWRYDKLHEKYDMYFKKDEFLIITKEFENQIQILDYFIENTNSLKMALSILEEIAQGKSKDLTMWIPKNHSLIKETNLKYEKLVAPQFFHVVSFDEKIKPYVLDSDKWHYSMSNSDIF